MSEFPNREGQRQAAEVEEAGGRRAEGDQAHGLRRNVSGLRVRGWIRKVWCIHTMDYYSIALKMDVFLKKLKVHLPYDLAISIYPKVKKDVCTHTNP